MEFFKIDDYMNDLRGKNIIIGGRGIGKTYSSLRYVIESKQKFIYLRNTEIQIAECSGEFGNPFKKLNKDLGLDIIMTRKKQHSNIIDNTTGDIIGYGCALSTFGNLRGVDLSDVTIVIFDEFIELKPLMFDQFKSFIHFYETVNRNRELFGEDPLKCILLSNSQTLNNPILIGYNLIEQIEHMTIRRQQKYKNGDIFVLLPESEISDLKAKTAHYQTLKGTAAYDEIIKNKFANDSLYGIIKRPLREYRALCKIDDMYIYMHKSNHKKYVCYKRATNIPEYNSKDNLLAFYKFIGRTLSQEYPQGYVEFSSFLAKSSLLKIIM